MVSHQFLLIPGVLLQGNISEIKVLIHGFSGVKMTLHRIGNVPKQERISCADVWMKDLSWTNEQCLVWLIFTCVFKSTAMLQEKSNDRNWRLVTFFPPNKNVRTVIGSEILMIYCFTTGKTYFQPWSFSFTSELHIVTSSISYPVFTLPTPFISL